MTAVGQFLANPHQFVNDNILVSGWYGQGRDKLNGATETMTFVTKAQNDGIARQLGRSLGLYFVIPVAMVPAMGRVIADTRTFEAYFCDYQQNQTFGVAVGHAADFMFTATMDGCSLGVGSVAPDGTRLVYHANEGGDQEKQRFQLGVVMGASLETTFEPSNYRYEAGQGVLKSTTFGVRSRASNTWNFYSQIYYEDVQANPRRYFLREVKTIC